MSQVQVMDDARFAAEVINIAETALVQFWAPWCVPCRRLTPIIEELATEYEGRVRFFKVNVDENQESAMQFQASSIPLLALVRNHPEDGHREAHLSLGFKPKSEVKAFIDALI